MWEDSIWTGFCVILKKANGFSIQICSPVVGIPHCGNVGLEPAPPVCLSSLSICRQAGSGCDSPFPFFRGSCTQGAQGNSVDWLLKVGPGGSPPTCCQLHQPYPPSVQESLPQPLGYRRTQKLWVQKLYKRSRPHLLPLVPSSRWKVTEGQLQAASSLLAGITSRGATKPRRGSTQHSFCGVGMILHRVIVCIIHY